MHITEIGAISKFQYEFLDTFYKEYKTVILLSYDICERVTTSEDDDGSSGGGGGGLIESGGGSKMKIYCSFKLSYSNRLQLF